MEGQLSEHPLGELIREISAKNLSGRLRAQQERAAVVVYFKGGNLIYAASNVRMFRLREYLIKDELLTEERLARFDGKRSDISLAKQLTTEGLINEAQAAQLQQRQVADILRLALLWIEGKWEFDSRSRLSEDVPFKFDWEPLLLDAGRRLPSKFTTARISNPAELFSPVTSPPQLTDLQPNEVFLLSRVDGPTSLSDLVALSVLPEGDTLRLVYALALSGLIQREHWKPAFRSDGQTIGEPAPEVAVEKPVEAPAQPVENEVDMLLQFLNRLDSATTHYEVLAVEPKATTAEIKKSYYEVARRYHPDRFRKDSDQDLNLRIESAFARVTQAYDTLRDPGLRATYDSKLDAQARARVATETAASSSSAAQPPPEQQSPKTSNRVLTDADRAEQHFLEAIAAKQSGQLNTAIGMFSSAARLVPHDARYRAHYGQALASHPGTRRLAEGELQAALKIEPENADYRVMLAELYRDLGFPVRARTEIEKVLKASRNHQKARELLRSL